MTWTWVEAPDQMPVIRELFSEYQHELGVDLCFQAFQEELDSLPGKYGPPLGALLLGTEEGRPVACGGLRPLEDGVCELKRIYVRAEHRGTGSGRLICEMLMQRGRELGYKVVRLDTLRRLAPAGKIYQRLGFVEIEPYNYNPEADIVYLERELHDSPSP